MKKHGVEVKDRVQCLDPEFGVVGVVSPPSPVETTLNANFESFGPVLVKVVRKSGIGSQTVFLKTALIVP